jgi:hypothetical protein
MTGTREVGSSLLTAVSKAMVGLHKEQFGRGPVEVRSAAFASGLDPSADVVFETFFFEPRE